MLHLHYFESSKFSINIYALMLHLNLFESLLLAMAICFKIEFGPKVIDIQEGYNKNFHEDHWTK